MLCFSLKSEQVEFMSLCGFLEESLH